MDKPIKSLGYYAVGPVAYVVATFFATLVASAASGDQENGYVVVFASILIGLVALVPFVLTKLVMWKFGLEGALAHLAGGAIFGGLAALFSKQGVFLFTGALWGVSYWAARRMGHSLVGEPSE